MYDAGILSLGGAASRIVSGASRDALLVEAELVGALRQRGLSVVSAGSPHAEPDRIAVSSAMMRRLVRTFVDARPSGIVLDLMPGATPGLVIETVRTLEERLKAPARVLLRAAPGSGAGARVRAAAGALRRLGRGPASLVGAADDGAAMNQAEEVLRFFAAREGAKKSAADVLAGRYRRKVLCVGERAAGPGGGMLDPDTVAARFGLAVESCPWSELEAHRPGDEDPRLTAALRAVGGEQRGVVERWLALEDLLHDHEAHALTLGEDASAEVLDWLASDTGPDGTPKDIVPAAPARDFDVVAAQLVVSMGLGLAAPRRRVDDVTAASEDCTLVRVVRVRNWMILLARELEEGQGAPSLETWPAPTAAVARGHIAAFLVETAHRLAWPYRVTARSGRTWHTGF